MLIFSHRRFASLALFMFFILLILDCSSTKINSKGHDTTTPRSSLSHSQEDYDSTSSESGEDDGWESDEAESSNSSEEILEMFQSQDEDDRNTTVSEEDLERMIAIPEDKLATVVERAYATGAEFASNLFASFVGKESKRGLQGQDLVPSTLPPLSSEEKAKLPSTHPPQKLHVLKVNAQASSIAQRRNHGRRHQKRKDNFVNPYI